MSKGAPVSSDGVHIHPRPRGDLVVCDGRCGACLPLGASVDAATADASALLAGWFVTSSMLRSFHHCPACRGEHEPQRYVTHDEIAEAGHG